jgi:hypothetical protein
MFLKSMLKINSSSIRTNNKNASIPFCFRTLPRKTSNEATLSSDIMRLRAARKKVEAVACDLLKESARSFSLTESSTVIHTTLSDALSKEIYQLKIEIEREKKRRDVLVQAVKVLSP